VIFNCLQKRKDNLKDINEIIESLDSIFIQIVQCFSVLAIFDLHGISNISLYILLIKAK
jgi:hypothetical protein